MFNKLTFGVCLTSIGLGTLLSFAMIWCDLSSKFVWKSWSTLGVVFLASLATLVVSKCVGPKEPLQ